MTNRSDIPPDLATRTRATYDAVAKAYDSRRGRFGMEEPWLDRLTQDLAPGSAVLDVGCGAGDPVALSLVARGFDVVGVDFSEPMLRLARARLPDQRFVLADMRHLALGQRFPAVLGWNSFFHLTAAEQRQTLPRLCAHLAPGGRMLLTVGPSAGETVGRVAGRLVYHASLSPPEYRAILNRERVQVERFVPEDPDTGGHTLLLCRRSP